MNNGYVISINGTHHISLTNWGNTICYALSSFQKLHSSPTLNKLLLSESSSVSPMSGGSLSQISPFNKLFSRGLLGGDDAPPIDTAANTFEECVLLILREYARVETIFTEYEQSHPEFLNADSLLNHPELDKKLVPIFDNLTRLLRVYSRKFVMCNDDGYSPQLLLRYFLFPILFHAFGLANFDKIIEEIVVDDYSPITALYSYEHVFKGSEGYLQYKYQDTSLTLFQEFLKGHPQPLTKSLTNRSAACVIGEIWADKTREKGGHAVGIVCSYKGKTSDQSIKDNNHIELYVIDDLECIFPIDQYYNLKMHTIFEIKLKDTDASFVARVTEHSPSMKFWTAVRSNTLDNSYKFEHVDENGKRVYKLKSEYQRQREEDAKKFRQLIAENSARTQIRQSQIQKPSLPAIGTNDQTSPASITEGFDSGETVSENPRGSTMSGQSPAGSIPSKLANPTINTQNSEMRSFSLVGKLDENGEMKYDKEERHKVIKDGETIIDEHRHTNPTPEEVNRSAEIIANSPEVKEIQRIQSRLNDEMNQFVNPYYRKSNTGIMGLVKIMLVVALVTVIFIHLFPSIKSATTSNARVISQRLASAD